MLLDICFDLMFFLILGIIFNIFYMTCVAAIITTDVYEDYSQAKENEKMATYIEEHYEVEKKKKEEKEE